MKWRAGTTSVSRTSGELDFQLSPDKLDATLDRMIPYEVAEQRLSGLMQSLLVAACLAITPLLKFIPEAVLWGYFAYMGVASLPGSQFFERMVLLLTDPRQQLAVAARWGHDYWGSVPLRCEPRSQMHQLPACLQLHTCNWCLHAAYTFPSACITTAFVASCPAAVMSIIDQA